MNKQRDGEIDLEELQINIRTTVASRVDNSVIIQSSGNAAPKSVTIRRGPSHATHMSRLTIHPCSDIRWVRIR
jgi:hypothetical protein